MGLSSAIFGSLALGLGIWAVWNLSPTDASPPIVAEDALVIQLAPTVTPSELRNTHEPLRLHLEQQLGQQVVFDIGENYQATARSLIDGQVSFAMLPYNTIRVNIAREPSLEILGVKVVGDSTTIDGHLVVLRSSEAQTLEDLKGGTLCYPDLLSNTGYRMPRAFITKQGLDPDEDFVPQVSGNHRRVLEDLLEGACDVGGTYSGNFNTARERGIDVNKLRIFAVTGSTPHDALISGPAAAPELTQTLKQALLSFESGVEDDGLIESGDRITGFTEPSDSYLDL